jgi:hypothetical protein
MKTWGLISFILFCLGLVLAIVGGLASPGNVAIGMVLVTAGIIIGVIYVVGAKDINTLLLATIALLAMTAALSPLAGIGEAVTSMILNFAALMAPVALIAAIKALIQIGLEK